MELAASGKDELLYLAGNHYLRMAERLVNTQTQRAPASLHSRLAAARIFESQGLYQLAAVQYLEAARVDVMNASVFLNLARTLTILDLGSPAAMALGRYRALMPSDSGAVIDRASLPRQRLLEIGNKPDFEGVLRNLPPVPDVLPPLPVMSAEVNEELRTKLLADRDGLWKTAVSDLCSGDFRAALNRLSALQRFDNGWLRNYLEATVRAWTADYEGAEKIATLPSFGGAASPLVQMLRGDIYQHVA